MTTEKKQLPRYKRQQRVVYKWDNYPYKGDTPGTVKSVAREMITIEKDGEEVMMPKVFVTVKWDDGTTTKAGLMWMGKHTSICEEDHWGFNV